MESNDQTATPASELLPCPFCGGAAYQSRPVNGTQMFYVGCAPCGIELKAAWYRDAERPSKDLVRLWKTRPLEAFERDRADKAEAERDTFETQAEQRGADLVAAEGTIEELQAEVERLKNQTAEDIRALVDLERACKSRDKTIAELREALGGILNSVVGEVNQGVWKRAKAVLAASEPGK